MTQTAYEQMIDILRRQTHLLLTGHEDPDCDCLGSLLAIYRAFGGEEKNWRLLLADPVPQNLRFLPGLSQMISPEEIDIEHQAVLLVDCGEPARAGAYLPPLVAGKKLYCIDHHISNNFAGDLKLVEPEASATGELVAALLDEAGIKVDADTALCLYSAIASDTGCFRYLNTTPRCLEQAGRLLPQVDLELVRVRLFEDRSYANLKMMAACLNNMQVECGGLLAYSWLDRDTMRHYGATAADCHNIVNYTLHLSNVKIGLLFEEYEGYVKLSFRARRGYRVDKLAAAFGGGGHLLAAGCKLPGNLEMVRPQVLAAVKEQLSAARSQGTECEASREKEGLPD